MKIFEIRLHISGNMREKDITEEIKQRVAENVAEEYDRFGIKVTIEDIHDAEAFVRNYFEGEGYCVYKLEPKNSTNVSRPGIPRGVIEALRVYCREYNYAFESDTLMEAGVPDFLMVKPARKEDEMVGENTLWWGGIEKAFFVEVKSKRGVLSRTQAKWQLDNDDTLPVRVFWVDNE